MLLSCISLCVIAIAAGTIAPGNAADTSSYDKMPNEFKNAEDYQILEFENSICAIDSAYNLVLNETNEKSFTYSLDDGNLEGIYISIKELDDDSSDTNPSDLKEPDYKYVESENLNIDNTPIKKVSFTDTHGGEPTNGNWVEHTIYSFNKNGKHYQIIFYDDDVLSDREVEKIIESFTEK